MYQILGIFFNPPMAFARLGGSDTPLESFTWAEDPSIFGAGRTIITPQISLEVQPDGSVRPYLPSFIRFRDNYRLRPVAPFFELWAKVRLAADAPVREVPLTLYLLQKAGGTLEGVTYHVTAANRKAERRTGDPTCAFSARIDVRATDHRRRPLMASSPRSPGAEPLVSDDRPIPLGHFQALKPILALDAPDDAPPDPLVAPAVKEMGADLGTLRVRYTPARGEVYGPPTATTAPAPTTNRVHEIVPPENRILNPRSSWLEYDGSYARFNNPEPSDTYDGASLNEGRSWGVVDDTCDVVIEAFAVVRGARFRAVARAFAGPPDFAPDRRPFISLADDLADRELPFHPPVVKEDEEVTVSEVADLFQRVFETVSLTNLDQLRNFSIQENVSTDSTDPKPPLPLTDRRMMTAEDVPYADKVIDFIAPTVAHARLPYADAAYEVHAGLADVENMVDLLRTFRQRVRMMIRPPYARLRELPEDPNPTCDPERLRDARNRRDNAQDMRMPPYMRSDTATALSLTRRQYDEIIKLLDYLAAQQTRPSSAEPAALADEATAVVAASPASEKRATSDGEKATADAASTPAPGRVRTALRQHVERVVERHRERQAERRDPER